MRSLPGVTTAVVVAVKHVGVLMMPSANPMHVGGRSDRPGSSISTGAGAGAAELVGESG